MRCGGWLPEKSSSAQRGRQVPATAAGVWGLGQALEAGWTPTTRARLALLPRLQAVLGTGAFPPADLGVGRSPPSA